MGKSFISKVSRQGKERFIHIPTQVKDDWKDKENVKVVSLDEVDTNGHNSL